MKVNKSHYKIFPYYVVYKPTNILNLEQVFENAIKISICEKLPVHLYLNDIFLHVYSDSSIKELMSKYLVKLSKLNKEKAILNNNQNKK